MNSRRCFIVFAGSSRRKPVRLIQAGTPELAKTFSARNEAAAIAASSGSPKLSVPRVSTGLPNATIESMPRERL